MRPRVSVVIPAFDRERYLPEAIASVQAQRLPGVEIVVVDDGSSDATAAAAVGFADVVCLRRPHAGAAAARNAGVAAARGELLAFLDSDDLWTPGALRTLTAVLDERRDVDLGFGLVEEFVSPELGEEEGGRLLPAAGPVPGYCAGAMLARRAAFSSVGPFDEGLRVGEFVDWIARARERGLRSHVVDEVVLRRRLHSGNLGRGDRDRRRDYVRLVKAGLDRRRSGER